MLGVSRSPDRLGTRLLRNLLEGGFGGEVWVVHPSGEPVLGRTTVPDVEALPLGLDLALVSLPAPAVPAAVRALAERHCRVVVVLASGFGEAGAEGAALERELRALVRAGGPRLLGPNCMGVVNVPGRLNASYFWQVPWEPGGLSFVSQSGAYGGLFFREVRARGLGVAKFVSIGNQVDLDAAACLAALADDPETRAVGLFVEGVPDGPGFLTAARAVSRRKPVVALKGGRSPAGRRAAGSHTGALAGEYEVFRAACRAAGVVLAEDTDGFFDALAACLAHAGRLPRHEGLAILTVSGGPSVVAADTAEAAGLRVVPLPDPLRRRLRASLPAFAADGNPVDMTPQIEPAAFGPVVRAVLEADEVAGAVALDIGLDRPEYGEALAQAQAATGKPVVACTVDTPGVDRHLGAAGIPVLPGPERAVRAWASLRAWAAARERPDPPRRGPRTPPSVGDPRGGRVAEPLDYESARALLRRYGVRFPPEAVAHTEGEALAAAAGLGYPVVMKTLTPGLLHKTEAGGVLLDLRGPDAVREAWQALSARFGRGPVLVQAQVTGGLELLVGGRRDPVFGPVVVLGLGGLLAEAFREVAVRLAPLHPGEAHALLQEGPWAPLLRGFRTLPPADETAVASVLVGIGDLLVDRPEVVELDVNPLVVRGAEVVAVDTLLLVGHEAGGPEGPRGG